MATFKPSSSSVLSGHAQKEAGPGAQSAGRPELQLVSIEQKYGVQAAELAHELSRSIRGEIRFDPASRSLYASDLSIYRQLPIGVVIPRDADDVLATVAACEAHEVLGAGAAMVWMAHRKKAA